MTSPNRRRKRTGLRPIPGDKNLFIIANLTRDPTMEHRFVEDIRRDVEQLEVDDRASKAPP